MYDEYCNQLLEQYHFQDMSYSMSIDNGFSVTITLTPVQVRIVNSKATAIEAIIFRAERLVCEKKRIPLAMLRDTRINGFHNQMKIAGSPDVIEVILFQLFSEE